MYRDPAYCTRVLIRTFRNSENNRVKQDRVLRTRDYRSALIRNSHRDDNREIKVPTPR